MTHRITIENGATFAVAAAEDSLLRGALRAGVGLVHECSVGGCGACRFELVEGSMQTLWDEAPGLSERERRRGRRLACQSRPLGDCTIRLRTDDAYLPPRAPRRQSVRLLERRQLTHDMIEFGFEAPAPADFIAGQYALLYPPGVEGARAYSMSNLANARGLWQFIVRRAGRGSSALFDTLAVGDAITLDGPYGHAWLRQDSPRDIVCVAGGSGLAPMLSIVRGALAAGDARRVHVFYGARSQADLGAADALRGLESDPRMRLHVVLSAPDASVPWDGATGFVHDALDRALGPELARHDIYYAGPPPMVEALQSLLMLARKVPPGQIHYDRFV